MKKTARNTILSILCGAFVAAAGSCATAVTYPVTVDGEKFRAGLYILEQQDALSEGSNKLTEEQPDLDVTAEGFSFFDQTLDGKKFGDWVNDEALEHCREYVAVERLFDRYGITITDADAKEINDNVRSLWTEENQYAQYYYGEAIIGKYYEKFGVGEQSFKELQINNRKRSALFTYLYGEGGQFAATQEEINNALQNDYFTANYFAYEYEGAGTAQSYADRIANGESYEEVYRDYLQAKSDAEAAEAAAAAEATADEEEGTDAAEETEAEPAEPAQIEVSEKNSLVKIIDKSSGMPSETFINEVSAMNAGDVKVVTVTTDDSSIVYVVQKLDILTLPDVTAATVETIRSDLKQDEYDELIKTTGAGYTLTTDSSIKLYKAEKLLES